MRSLPTRSDLVKATPLAVLAVLVASMLVRATASAADFEEEALQWHVRAVPAGGDEVELIFSADIAPGWILYASDFEAQLGPRPARFTFDPGVKTIGPLQAVKSLRRTDKTWNTEYSYFEKRAEFRQKIKGPGTVSGRIDGQTCYETTGLCALFRKEFSLRAGT